MAAMNPILRLRRAFRSMGAEPEQADEVADAIDDHAYGRRESDMRYAQLMAEYRRDMERLRNEFLLGVLIIVGIAVAILALVN
ncbi:MAG: hypothetical protein OXH38_02000 [Chloroflexi bacterium]|nr:hypothetical protein [Chloroflexota bacterium]